jgi:uncharacterized protein
MASVKFGEFEWDSNKDEANQKKHGIAFKEAVDVFDAPYLKVPANLHDEPRWVALGKVQLRVIAVIFTERGGRTRIISARTARKKEREIYREGVGDTS